MDKGVWSPGPPALLSSWEEHWTEVTRCCRTNQQWEPGIHFPSIRNICWTDLEIEMGELTSNGVKGTFHSYPLLPPSLDKIFEEADATKASGWKSTEGGGSVKVFFKLILKGATLESEGGGEERRSESEEEGSLLQCADFSPCIDIFGGGPVSPNLLFEMMKRERNF
ncbi:hypothetical protein NPIL_679121 [Nephila pilipes]|uniref:Uncharacterized protein n=1 Tax=Nephila pilipes TaxID=299642 RepID=A0A8X6NMW3_NEPPI|nr:hypothetical protein NPIL_679121 [Nephila pilipes]